MSLMDLASQANDQQDDDQQDQQPAPQQQQPQQQQRIPQPAPIDFGAFQRNLAQLAPVAYPRAPPPPQFPQQPATPPPKPPAQAPLGPLAQNDQPDKPAVLGGEQQAQAPEGPRQPYIMTQAHSMAPSAWGRPDYIQQGAQDYPGLAPGPYMPQPNEFGTLIPMIAMGLGRWGSRYSGMPAIAMASFFSAYQQARQQGQVQKQAMAERQYRMSLAMTAQRQAEENREYGDAYAAYGPHTDEETGKFYPGNEAALTSAIHVIAGKYGDDNMRAVLQTGGVQAAEQIIKHREGLGQDANKVLTQELKRAELQEKIDKINATRKKTADAAQQREPFLDPVPGGVSPGSVSTGPPPPEGTSGGGSDDLEWLPQFGGGSKPPAEAKKKAGEAEGAPAEADTEAPAAAPEATPPTTGPTSQAAPAQPEQAAAAEPQPGQVQMAGGESTGDTATDAPPPEAAALTPPRGTQAAPAAAPAAPRGERAPAAPSIPPVAGGTPERKEGPYGDVYQAPDSGVEWKPPDSSVLTPDKLRTSDGRSWNRDAVNTLAQQLVNGTVKIYEQRRYPPEMMELATARGLEIVRDMNAIVKDKSLSGEAVYRAMDRVNPQFTPTLRGTVEGRVSLPTTAWANWDYRNRLIGLGSKVDPGFNEFNAKTRQAVYKAFATGQEAHSIEAIAVAYRHLKEFDDALDKMPNAFKRQFLTRGSLGSTIGSWVAGLSDEDRRNWGELNAIAKKASDEVATALGQGKPTLGGQIREEQQINLATGDYLQMKGNVDATRRLLGEKLDQWQNTFQTMSGNQPAAMMSYFERVRGLANPDVQDLRDLRSPQAPTAPVGTAPVGTPTPAPAAAAPAAPQIGEVRRGWRFNGGDPSSPSSWTKQ